MYRFAPVYAAVLYFEAFIVEHLSSGPDWYSLKQNSQSCRKYWWTHLLYINNYYHTDAIKDVFN